MKHENNRQFPPQIKLAAIAAFVLAAGGPALTAEHSASKALPSYLDTGTHVITEAAPGIYVVEPAFAGANAAFLINEGGVIVVDSHSSPASSAALIDTIKLLTDLPVRYVINTHWHVDHHSGNEAYLDEAVGRVDIISHAHTREDIPTLGREQFEQTAPFRQMPMDSATAALQSGTAKSGIEMNESQREAVRKFQEAQAEFLAIGDAFEFTLPNVTIDRSLALHGTPHSVQVLHFFPAHTRGDVVVYVPEHRLLIAGDLLTKPILWTWSSYPQDYVRTLKALEALDIEKILIGHGGPILEGKEYLTTARQLMETIVAFVKWSRENGLSLEDTIKQGSSYLPVQDFRRLFVDETEQQNLMFDQMISWTIDRAWAEFAAN